ncbi:molybdenum cofactor guanylyltransferase [Faucicola mancuniensis]|uniref:molybdenum cofactor guanylyltransferase n=1 Tax=Faucicola mancuniensis TaxID=1309795 RepID=UPI0028EDB70E|nr:molybdenum cofactor guanylyltransferase [uncultured Moraxella sp.]
MVDLLGIVILAGGESSRMGSPKALLKLANGETLLEFHIRHAKNLNAPVMVADNSKHFCQNKSVKIIDDYIKNDEAGKGAGALSAIAGAIENLISQNGYLMVISCDCLIEADLVFAKLVHQIIDEDVIYFKGEKDYPLLGLYRVDLLLTLKDFLDKGNRSVMKFLSDKKVKTVDLPNEWGKLANFNTLDEFNLAVKN